jgi:hypothetical protein
MNSKSTLYLTVLALGSFAYIYFFERHTLDTEQRAERAMKLFPDFDVGEVASVEIIRSNTVIRVERARDQWQMTRPIPIYPAQSTAIENWLGLFHALNRRACISAEELQAQPGGVAAFGLEEPQATVTVQQGQKKLRLLLGAKTPIGEKLYVRQVGSDGVLVTESALLDRMPPSAVEWRDPVFLRLAGWKLDQLHVRAGAREFTVERDPASRLWRLTAPRSARADNALLHQLLQQLQTAHVDQFVSDAPGGDLEPYGLQAPEVVLTFGQGTNNLTVEFGKSPTNNPAQVYARRSNYPMIVTVPGPLVEKFRAPYTDFLDKRLVEFSPAAVERIEARAAESFALQKQSGGSWRIIEPFDAPADPVLVEGFLSRLNSLQMVDLFKEVVTAVDLPNYGLAPPTHEYTLKSPAAGATNPLLARIEFGTNQAGKIFVRRSDESSVYTMRLEDCQLLAQAAFELRDRRIWNFTTNQVTGLTIEFKGKTYKLVRGGDSKWKIAEGSQGMVHPFAIEETVFRFGQLRSKAWDACGTFDSARYGFASPPHKLSIDVNAADKQRTFIVEFSDQSSPSGGPYARVDLEAGQTVFDFPFDIFNIYTEVLRSLTATVGATP